MNVGGLDLELVLRTSAHEHELARTVTQLQMQPGVRGLDVDDQLVYVDVTAPKLREDIAAMLLAALSELGGVEDAETRTIAKLRADLVELEGALRTSRGYRDELARKVSSLEQELAQLAAATGTKLAKRDRLVSSSPIDDALAVLGDVAVYPNDQLLRLIDWATSHFIDGQSAEYALALRNVANAVHPLRLTRASVELVARELSRVNQLEVETPSKWDDLSDGARHSWLVTAERLLAQL